MSGLGDISFDSEKNPSHVIDRMVKIDEDINLKTNIPIKAPRELLRLKVFNAIKNNPGYKIIKKADGKEEKIEFDAYDIAQEILDRDYPVYMASVGGWRSIQIIDAMKQMLQQIINSGTNTFNSMMGKK